MHIIPTFSRGLKKTINNSIHLNLAQIEIMTVGMITVILVPFNYCSKPAAVVPAERNNHNIPYLDYEQNRKCAIIIAVIV